MIDSDVMSRMYAQIVQGIAKDQSTLVVDDEHSQWWDEVAAEVAAMREADPTVTFEVPNEVPSIAGALPDQPAAPATPPPPDQAPAGPEPQDGATDGQ